MDRTLWDVSLNTGLCPKEHSQRSALAHTQRGIAGDAPHVTFSIRIRSPHSASSTLSIIIKSSLVIFHCLLAKWTTAKSLPYCPVAIILLTFCTTSAGKGQEGISAEPTARREELFQANRATLPPWFLPG